MVTKPPKPKSQAKAATKKKKKPANPNLNPGTKQTEKTRRNKMNKVLQDANKKFLKIGGPRPKLK
tara:strand:- start:78 stop:272 length:195 start_codon:yes stop_codon:yes gene_type:complete